MNAIRQDETLDNTHSLYVDQWDWERVITREERKVEFLKKIVRKIYSIFKRTEHFIQERYPAIRPELPEEITFIHTKSCWPATPSCPLDSASIGCSGNAARHSSSASAATSGTTRSMTGAHRTMTIGPRPPPVAAAV
jgi:hypothetical protein